MSGHSDIRRAKVLVIDDELGPRESVRILLKPDYEVLCADSVDRGLDLLRQHQPELVILDIRMPGRTGIEGLQDIRAADPHVSIVMLTGFGALETAQQAIRLGANDYVCKPFDTQEMRDMVRRYVERTRIQRQGASMQDQLRQINERLTEELARRERLAAVGQASSEMAHDLRSPLMVISGYAELLARQIEEARGLPTDAQEKAIRYLEAISQNVQRCCQMVNEWMMLGRVGRETWKEVPLTDVLTDVASGVKALAEARRVEVHVHPPEENVSILGHRFMVIRALRNLAVNAIQACTPGQGDVWLTARLAGNEVEIRVEDTGCGIPEEIKPRLFEPYFTTKTDGTGAGLGLAIVKRVVEDHGGRIEVDSRVGMGTTFLIRLPRCPLPLSGTCLRA